MGARFVTLVIWAAVLAGAVAWALPFFTPATPVPPGAGLAAPAPPAGGSLVRLMGQAPPPPAVAEAPAVVPASRFHLVGVVAPRAGSRSGLALIAVDGKPARAIGVGREVEPGLKLLSVAHRQAELGAQPGAPSVTLNLAPLPEAQRGRPDDQHGAVPAMPSALPAAPRGLPGAPGAMRVPPMPGSPQGPVTQPARPVPGAIQPGGALPQGMSRQGMGDGVSLPYQPDGSHEAPLQNGGTGSAAMR